MPRPNLSHCLFRQIRLPRAKTADRYLPFLGWCFMGNLVCKALAVLLCLPFAEFGTARSSPTAAERSVSSWFDAIIIAPIWETVVFQLGAIELARRFTSSRRWHYVAGTLPFALLHLFGGPITFVVAGLVGGFWLSHCYVEQRRFSMAQAAIMTGVLHGTMNAFVPLIAQVGRTLTE